mmetsp:Transcript_21085/g.54427  ORF Transcript_21085/g.54427 Transcript_21085/m.54427 type:complete len:254 (-) Transcript_21085:1067-1828(-)
MVSLHLETRVVGMRRPSDQSVTMASCCSSFWPCLSQTSISRLRSASLTLLVSASFSASRLAISDARPASCSRSASTCFFISLKSAVCVLTSASFTILALRSSCSLSHTISSIDERNGSIRSRSIESGAIAIVGAASLPASGFLALSSTSAKGSFSAARCLFAMRIASSIASCSGPIAPPSPVAFELRRSDTPRDDERRACMSEVAVFRRLDERGPPPSTDERRNEFRPELRPAETRPVPVPFGSSAASGRRCL